MLPDGVRRVLVVEDEPEIRDGVGRMLEAAGAVVVSAPTVEEARRALVAGRPPDLLLVDVRLPDESVVPLLHEVAALCPAPLVVAMSGVARPEETFELGPLGVGAFLAKPFGRRELLAAIETADRETRPFQPAIRALVGRVPMREVQREVRSLMVREALARTEGSRSGAARLLHVTRQAVQQILREGATDDR